MQVISLKPKAQLTQGWTVGAWCPPLIAHAQHAAARETNRRQPAGGQECNVQKRRSKLSVPLVFFFLPTVNAGKLNHEHDALLLFLVSFCFSILILVIPSSRIQLFFKVDSTF
jgi:hypothetical protein